MTLIKQPWETDAYFEHQSQAVAESTEKRQQDEDNVVNELCKAMRANDWLTVEATIRVYAATNTRAAS